MDFSVTFEVNAPAGAVWETMSDIEHWSEWTASIRDIMRLDDGEFRVGSSARVRQPRLPTAVWTVDEIEPGRFFTWTSRTPGVASTGVHRVDDLGDRSSVTLGIRQTGALAPLLGAIYGRLTRRYVQMEADGLKRYVESRPTA